MCAHIFKTSFSLLPMSKDMAPVCLLCVSPYSQKLYGIRCVGLVLWCPCSLVLLVGGFHLHEALWCSVLPYSIKFFSCGAPAISTLSFLAMCGAHLVSSWILWQLLILILILSSCCDPVLFLEFGSCGAPRWWNWALCCSWSMLSWIL